MFNLEGKEKNNQHTIDIIPFYIDTVQGINNISFENMKHARNAFSEDSLVFFSCPHNIKSIYLTVLSMSQL